MLYEVPCSRFLSLQGIPTVFSMAVQSDGYLPSDSSFSSPVVKQSEAWKLRSPVLITKYDLDIQFQDYGVVSASIPEDVTDDGVPLWQNFVIDHFIGRKVSRHRESYLVTFEEVTKK